MSKSKKSRDSKAILTVPKYFDTFKDSPHGWMAACRDLSGPHKPNYERGYKLALKWFSRCELLETT